MNRRSEEEIEVEIDSALSKAEITADSYGTADEVLEPAQICIQSEPRMSDSGLSLVPPSHLSSSIKNKKVDCSDDACLCSICMSPLVQETDSIETKCKHIFHRSCLLASKCWKLECPNCRRALSPPSSYNLSTSNADDQVMDIFRDSLHGRVSNAREAVRLATVRRDHERQRSQTVGQNELRIEDSTTE